MEEQRLLRARQALATAGIDAWLVYDFRGSNPVLEQILAPEGHRTRGCFVLIPVVGAPIVLAHAIEAHLYAGADFEIRTYAGRQDMDRHLQQLLRDIKRVAMEYVPEGGLPVLSWVDGGTLDRVRRHGVEVVSSADLYEAALAVWDRTALDSHRHACAHVVEVKDMAFDRVRQGLAAGEVLNEYQVQSYIAAEFDRRGLDMDHPPIVAVNDHSGNPHYAPQPDNAAVLGSGDWLLIDLWARLPGRQHVFGDITWVGYCGRRVPARQQEIFDLVRRARDEVLTRLQGAWQAGEAVRGFELDRLARKVVETAGMGQFFVHRTGHSLGPGPSVHGMGANLDDFETRDTRQILPGTGFTIEPGVYLPDFGVRLEVNVYVDPVEGPQLTTPAQEQVLLLE
jgi:Xaa-Pro dipeptidase